MDALGDITNGPTIWHPVADSGALHTRLWNLLEDECDQFQNSAGSADLSAFAHLLLDVGQGLRKILLRLDALASIGSARAERLGVAAVELIAHSTDHPLAHPGTGLRASWVSFATPKAAFVGRNNTVRVVRACGRASTCGTRKS